MINIGLTVCVRFMPDERRADLYTVLLCRRAIDIIRIAIWLKCGFTLTVGDNAAVKCPYVQSTIKQTHNCVKEKDCN